MNIFAALLILSAAYLIGSEIIAYVRARRNGIALFGLNDEPAFEAKEPGLYRRSQKGRIFAVVLVTVAAITYGVLTLLNVDAR